MSSRPPDTAPALSVQGSGGEDGGEVPAFTSKDTAALLRSAAGVAEALKYKDYEALAGYVHPERGVTFTAYSTVNLETDQNFSADQIRELAQDDTRYLWGYEDGRGEPIQRTIAQFLEEFIFSVDYTQATSVGVDEIVMSGNSLENLEEAYPDLIRIGRTHLQDATPLKFAQEVSGWRELVEAPCRMLRTALPELTTDIAFRFLVFEKEQ